MNRAATSREANEYAFATLPSAPLRTCSACLDRKAPWFQIKEDRQAAATTVYVTRSVRVVDSLKTILAPTRSEPYTAQKLHEYLGYEGQLLGAQQVVEYQEETRSHEALTYDHSGAVGTHSLRSVHAWAKSALPALRGAFGSGAGAARAGAAVQEAG